VVRARTLSIAAGCGVAARVELAGSWGDASALLEDHGSFEEALGAAARAAGVDEVVADLGAEARRGSRFADAWVVLANGEAEVAAFAAELRRIAPPKVAYAVNAEVRLARVPLARAAASAGEVRFQAGGPSRFARVALELRPLAPADAVEEAIACAYAPDEEIFPEVDFAGVARDRYVAAMFDGVAQAAKLAVAAGLPSSALRATITGGFHHLVDSHPDDFALAAGLAFRDAVRAAARAEGAA
jgi:hypothetical protein